MSDLHLEVGQQYSRFVIPACAPYLVLAGDIGHLCDYQELLDFLAVHCQIFRHVFFALDNHEFFGGSRSEGLAVVQKLKHKPILQGKFSLLHRSRVDLSENIKVLGYTLQSCILPESRTLVESKVNDCKKIGEWSVHDHNAEHLLDVE